MIRMENKYVKQQDFLLFNLGKHYFLHRLSYQMIQKSWTSWLCYVHCTFVKVVSDCKEKMNINSWIPLVVGLVDTIRPPKNDFFMPDLPNRSQSKTHVEGK